MIRLENVSKSYPSQAGQVQVLRNINLTVERGQRLGILGRNGAGKSTLIRLLSGAERPTSGNITRQMSVSWPLAFGGAFLGRLTGYDNFKFISRLYNVDPASKIGFVEDFSELGPYLREPLRTYSAGMRARLAFAVSMAVEFDCFLIDEIIAVGDSRFQAKCFDELFVKRADRALLIVSHHADFVREFCSSAAVLEGGVLRACPSVDAAYELYSAQQAMRPPAVSLALDTVAENMDPTIAVGAEIAKGEFMEDRAQSFANIVLELTRDPAGSGLLPSIVQAFSGELGDFAYALRVIDNLKALGSAEAAIDLAAALEHFHGGNDLFHVVVGDLLLRNERVKEAIAAYQKAIDIEPESFWGQRNLGIGLFNIGCYADARAAFERAVAQPCPESLKRELVCYLIDCATYLDQDSPQELKAIAPFPGDSIEEVTAVHYPELGLLSVRVQGFRASHQPARPLQLSFQVGTDLYQLPSDGLGSNSRRRYAALAAGGSYGAELLIRVAQDPGTVSVTLYDGSKQLAHQAAIATRSDGRALPAEHGLESDPAQLAALAYAAHDFESCILFSRLALAEGGTVDYESLAESLIAHGRYHDAEYHLGTLFEKSPAPPRIDGDSDKLFDLLCSEIGRSRLSGWQGRIDQLIADRLAAAPDNPSALTNQGHLLVSEDRLAEAVPCYARAASSAAALEVIHFNRGIFSAQFVQLAEAAPQAKLEAPEPANELVHLISCDATYFKRYGAAVVRSSRTAKGHERTSMHVHMVDPDLEALDLARALQTEFDFNLTTEFFPLQNAPRRIRIAYYTAARFMCVPKLLQMYQRPVLITETDCLINWSWPDIIDWCSGADFGSMQSALNNFVPWTKIPAGIIYFDHRDQGQAIAAEVEEFLRRLFFDDNTHKYDLWTIDQVALWLAWQRYQHSIAAVHLPMYSMLQLATGDKTNIL